MPLILLLSTTTALAQTEHCDTLPSNLLQEVTVVGRNRISPLRELTVEPLAWESSITYITADDNHKTAAHHLFDALKYSVNGVASTQGRRKKHYYLLRGQNVASDKPVTDENSGKTLVSSYRSDRFLKAEVDMGNYCNADVQFIYHIQPFHLFIPISAEI